MSTLMEKGPAGIFEMIQEQLNPQTILDAVIDAVKDYLIETLITKVTVRILALFNPAGAILQAIEAIYKVLKWIFENASRIFTLVETVVNGAADILAGKTSGLANAIETALAGLISPVIGFLADYIGLGGIPEAIKNAVLGLQQRVEKILDRVISFLADKAKQLLAAVGLGKTRGASTQDGALGKEMAFKAQNESHRLWIEQNGDSPTVKVASTPQTVKAKLDDWQGRTKDATDEKLAKELLSTARSQLGDVNTEATKEAAAEKQESKNPSPDNKNKADGAEQKTINEQRELLGTLAKLFEQFEEDNVFKILNIVGQKMIVRAQTKGADTPVKKYDPRELGTDGKRQYPGYLLAHTGENSEKIKRLYIRRLDSTAPPMHLDREGKLRKGARPGGGPTLEHLARRNIRAALEWVAKESTDPKFEGLTQAEKLGDWVAVFATGGRKLTAVRGDAAGGPVTLSDLWPNRREVLVRVRRAILDTFSQDEKFAKRLRADRKEWRSAASKAAKEVVAKMENRELYFVDRTSIPRQLTQGPHVIVKGNTTVSASLYTQIATKSNDELLSKLQGEIHHFVPLYIGGSHDEHNLVRAEGAARVKENATRITAHAQLHQLIDETKVR
ncbi:MAG: HNH endonuclease signature motif containing protein, partial [Myxococcota bacterium]